MRAKDLVNINSPKSKLLPIMFAGTGSDVGKSIIATGFCRVLLQDGYKPAPFKAQNMALNSFATPEGLEIGRAQAVQAEAAGISCNTDMNPILLKPNTNLNSQVILNGKSIGNQSALSYFKKEKFDYLKTEVNGAFDRLASKFNPIVLEGAGSISEINLRDTDLVNMAMAIHAGAAVVLVADIDRGGVFASIYGSIQLLTPKERKHIKGIIINKFRGDLRLFESGIKIIEDLCHIPVLGVVPYYKDIHIEEEDSVALSTKNISAESGKINIAAVLLRHLSNFTDFNVIEQDERVHLYYTNNVEEIKKADIIIIPGSKSTLDDIYELRKNGVAQAIVRASKDGKTVLGICGGFQMMGVQILDPDHVEGDIESLPGLSLLPTITTMSKEKITQQINFTINNKADDKKDYSRIETYNSSEAQINKEKQDCLYDCKGYEIHMGRTEIAPYAKSSENKSLNKIEDGRYDGYIVNNKCMGTYIHGILDNPQFIDFLLEPYTDKLTHSTFNYSEFKEEQYDKLAEHIRKYVDIPLVYKILEGKI